MNVIPPTPPTWQLAGERCPCCDGNGELVFSICPQCRLAVLICAEVGNVFAISDRRRGQQLGWVHSASDKCTGCGRVSFADFRDATADEILALGFRPGDYE
jgi:hypothetical protein